MPGKLKAGAAKIRPYSAGDEGGICRLFSAVHDRELPLELWRWRYRENPAGPAVIDVAVAQGQVVAHLGTLPVRLSGGAGDIRCGLWTDLMVHPDFRDLELFLDLAERHRERAAAAGVGLLFAFPNDRSYPVLKRMLDWSCIEEIDALEAPAARLRPEAPPPAGWSVDPVKTFDPGFDALWEALRPKAELAATRDRAWLQWRYGSKPGADYAIWTVSGPGGRKAGWAAAKLFDSPAGRIGDILDLWAEPEGPGAALLFGAAVSHFKARKAETVSAWALKAAPLCEFYLSQGLSPEGPRSHFAGLWAGRAETARRPPEGKQWRIAKGDSDVF